MSKPKTENSPANATLSIASSDTLEYVHTTNLVADACTIIDTARTVVQRAVNWTLVQRNWLLGKRIAEEELRGENRAELARNSSAP